MDDDNRTLEAIEDLAAHARRSGALIGALTALTYRGWLAARRGDLAAAEADLRTAMEVSVQNEMPMLFVTMAMFLQDAVLERPSLDDVVALVESTRLGADFLSTFTGALLLQTRGRLRLARGEHQGAAADLRACGEVLVPLGGGPPIFFWRSELARALPAVHREEAVALVTEDLTLAEATGLARAHGIALRHAGLVLDGDRGLVCLRESVARLAAPRPGWSMRDRWSSTALRCAGAASAPRRGSRWPPGWSSPTAAARSGSSPGPGRNCGSPGPARAASSAPASTRSP